MKICSEKELSLLIKEKSYKFNKKNIYSKFFYSFKFASIFYPGSIKNISLFIRSSINKDDTSSKNRNGTFKNTKILIKQSYLLVIWMHYLSKKKNDETTGKLPSFFIYPYSQSKFTHIKAPIAHKTFSQEQFMIRYYNISVSFKPSNEERKNKTLSSVNKALYAANFIRSNLPFLGTNMLFLKKINYMYNSTDENFYSYYIFNKINK